MKPLTKKVFKDIFHRKVRATLTIIGIAIGILGLSAINTTSYQLSKALAFISDTGAQPDIQFTTTPTTTSTALIQSLSQQPHVTAVQTASSISTRWSVATGHVPFTIVGYKDFHNIQINKLELVEGKLPGHQQVLLESSDNAIKTTHVGDQIEVDVDGSPQKLTVSGFVRTRGRPSSSLLGSSLGYMNGNDVEELFHEQGDNLFLIRLDQISARSAATKSLSYIFEAKHVMLIDTLVGYNDQVTATVNGVLGAMQSLSILALLLSIVLLLSTISTFITEQFRIIGSLKAIGAVRSKVMRHYFALVTIYGIIGTVIGFTLGIIGGYYLVNYLGAQLDLDIGSLQVPWWLVLECAIVGILIPLISAFIPIYVGTRITVQQALNNYGLEGSNAQQGFGWATITKSLFGFFPQTIQLGMRSLFRKRWRAVLALVTLSIAGVAFFAVLTVSYSFTSFLGQVFSTYHFDVVVSVPTPQPYSSLQQAITKVPGVKASENLSWSSVTTKWGTAMFTGVQVDTKLYQKQLVAGRWFRNGDSNVAIISQDAATRSGLKVGDSISFHDSLHSATWHIIGIVVDYNGTAPNAFGVLLAPIAQINAFLGLPANYSRIMMIQSTSANATDINALEMNVDKAMSAAGFLPSESTAQQEIQQNETRYNIFFALLYIVAIIIALVGTFGLFNMLAMNVSERRREIGILRSMGATGRQIVQVFLTEAIFLSTLSWICAVLIGIPIAYEFVHLIGSILLPVPFSFNPIDLVIMLVFILFVSSLASIGPVLGTARIKIAQTLRYE